MVREAGVERIRVLTARKLLIPGSATTAKTAKLPDPLYVYCTKMLWCRCHTWTCLGRRLLRCSSPYEERFQRRSMTSFPLTGDARISTIDEPTSSGKVV